MCWSECNDSNAQQREQQIFESSHQQSLYMYAINIAYHSILFYVWHTHDAALCVVCVVRCMMCVHGVAVVCLLLLLQSIHTQPRLFCFDSHSCNSNFIISLPNHIISSVSILLPLPNTVIWFIRLVCAILPLFRLCELRALLFQFSSFSATR